MRIQKTEWPPKNWDGQYPISIGNQVSGPIEEQPGFGLQVIWNHPKKMQRPVIILTLWRYSIQVGWLYD